jgi:hypothetical protein
MGLRYGQTKRKIHLERSSWYKLGPGMKQTTAKAQQKSTARHFGKNQFAAIR